MTYSAAVGKRIKDLCRQHGITINKLSSISGVPNSTICNIVKGRTNKFGYPTINRIAKGFGMTLSEFDNFPEINELQFQDDE